MISCLLANLYHRRIVQYYQTLLVSPGYFINSFTAMKKIISIIFAGLALGCSQDKTQTDTKAPDTVVVIQQPAAATHQSSTRTTTTTTTTTQTPQQKKDALDKANDALDNANKTVTKTSDAVDKAAELKRKTDDLLNKPH